ncbi:NAD(P)H-dependent flavin oxidoreductase [Chitinasiproducens palmae]|uniref:Enoyl-[acyl-carrier protein] reductase II n=1 Tax=Chitinasiproducens palmae TaxID=1770053 RepID=A0A1H2PLS5_9BURK|nr:nitronate monooxygenase [Chitinasiproducens palmae]SDV46988.1 enoyl-[acyl-carrier protein] reductase II [Chitinasiproducens palmae]
MTPTRLTRMLSVRYPIIQAGMSWASSNAALPAAVSNAGGLGVIAAGPMYLDAFRQAVREVKAATNGATFGVNLPLYRPAAASFLDVIEEERVPVVFASQGGPKAHLERFQRIGTRWIHVVSTIEHARKAANAGVDALVVVGSEAGGHPPANGVSTLIAVRRAAQEFSIPIVAGGGVADGFGIAALLALGADAVQLGTRFIATREAGVHDNYKRAILDTDVADTVLVGVRGLPVRMTKNRFADAVLNADRRETDDAAYDALFKSSTLKQAALDGDVERGKVELGQSAGLIHDLPSAAEVMARLVQEYEQAVARLVH